MLGFQLGESPLPQQARDNTAHKVLLQNADGQIVASISRWNLLFARVAQAVPDENMSYNAEGRWACGFGFLGFSFGASLAVHGEPEPGCVGQILLHALGGG